MKQEILKLLKKLDIKYRWVEHPAVFTVEEAQKHTKDKWPIKNLLLQEKGSGRKVLVVIDGNTRMDANLVARKLGTKKLQFAKPEVLLETFGVMPGAVSIFGLLGKNAKDVEVVIGEALLSKPELGFHPNDNTATVFITGRDTERIVHSTGNLYHIMNLG